MTALSLIAGNLPIAIGFGEGTEVRRGLSVVVIGGMISATLLTLLILPTAYSLVEGLLRWIGGLFRRKPEDKDQQQRKEQQERQAGQQSA
jgi:HAE1 family hydrophobic/amphiphilic exporter-1